MQLRTVSLHVTGDRLVSVQCKYFYGNSQGRSASGAPYLGGDVPEAAHGAAAAAGAGLAAGSLRTSTRTEIRR
jgi:hypothetical protein